MAPRYTNRKLKYISLYYFHCTDYFRPLTLSESLAKFAQKIDFSKTSELEVKKEDSADEAKSDTDSKDAFQSSLWPWDSVRSKLRNALQEVCVLADVLTIAKEKRYLVLDPVQQEPLETKPMVQIYARKKALAGLYYFKNL